MKISFQLAIVAMIVDIAAAGTLSSALAADRERALLQADRALFRDGTLRARDSLLDQNFTWTDYCGHTETKAQFMEAVRSRKKLEREACENAGGGTNTQTSVTAHVYGNVGIVQQESGHLYTLRVWVKRDAGWRALIYQDVATGAPASAEPGKSDCKNPCETVPFAPRSKEEREVIGAYQAVEQAVAGHDSAAWGVHIADEFFAVTSNSDRPVDKATRMAGLDNQKVAGIAPFPLVWARMFQFGDAMVMVSQQKPVHGLPLRVTRVWFKRNGTWLEAYSYQTTVQQAVLGQ